MDKKAKVAPHFLDDPAVRALAGMGLGGIVGASLGSKELGFADLTPEEQQDRIVYNAVRGAGIGTSLGVLPTALGIRFGG